MSRNDTENPNVMVEPIFVTTTFKWTFYTSFSSSSLLLCDCVCACHKMHSIQMVFLHNVIVHLSTLYSFILLLRNERIVFHVDPKLEYDFINTYRKPIVQWALVSFSKQQQKWRKKNEIFLLSTPVPLPVTVSHCISFILILFAQWISLMTIYLCWFAYTFAVDNFMP